MHVRRETVYVSDQTELSEQLGDCGDQAVRGRFQDHGGGRPLSERAVDPPGVEDERDAAVDQSPADGGAVGIAQIKIQYAG